MIGEIKYVILVVVTIAVGFLGVGAVAAADIVLLDESVVVGGSAGNVYTPDEVTIGVGEAVTWNNAGGFHNVVAYDGSFSSGGASPSAWEFSHTFNAPGIYTYYCTPHESIGMTGTVTVVGSTSVTLNAFELAGDDRGLPPRLIGTGIAGLAAIAAVAAHTLKKK